jgi:hypothetical protein
LEWLQADVPERERVLDSRKARLRELIQAGSELNQADKIAAIRDLKNSSFRSGLVDNAIELVTDVYYAARDILSNRKVKTSLAIVGGMGLCAGIGAVLGTLVFPVLGTAIGGAVGAAIAGGVAAVGGPIGLGIIGAVAGSWLGKKFSNYFFSSEKRFELSRKTTDEIKRQSGLPSKKLFRRVKPNTGISSKTAQLMNGYLYNRRKAINSPLCKKYYKILRKNGLYEADPMLLEKCAHFFCHEIILLQKELKKKPQDAALQKDLEAVWHIVNKLKKAEGFSAGTRLKIAKTIKDNEKTMPFAAAAPSSQMKAIKDNFVHQLKEADSPISSVRVSNSSHHRTSSYEFKVTTKNGEKLPSFTYSEIREGVKLHSEVSVDRKKLSGSKKGMMINVLAEQAKAYANKTGNKEVTVFAGGDDKLAVQLMAAALREKLKPKLDPEEYPEYPPEKKERKEAIVREAEKLYEAEKRAQNPRLPRRHQ